MKYIKVGPEYELSAYSLLTYSVLEVGWNLVFFVF